MVWVGYDTSNLVALYEGGVLCSTCCPLDVGCVQCIQNDIPTPQIINLRLTDIELNGCQGPSGFPGDDCGDPSPRYAKLNNTNIAELIDGVDFMADNTTGSSCIWVSDTLFQDEVTGTFDVYEGETPPPDPCSVAVCFSTDILGVSLLVARNPTFLNVVIRVNALSPAGGSTFYSVWEGRFIFDDEPNVCIDGSGSISIIEPILLLTVDHFVVWSECNGDTWANGVEYVQGKRIDNVACYNCILDHTSALINKPGEGANWEIYWEVI